MSEAAAAFDALAAEFFSAWFRFHPELAASVGLPDYLGRLPPQGDDEVAALGSWLEALVVALEELDYLGLDAGRRIDLQLMFGAARAEHQSLLERDWRHRDPVRFLPLESLYRLVLWPEDGLRDRLLGLLGGLPEHLRLALGQLRTLPELVPPLLVEAAVDEVEQARCYLRELVASPGLRSRAGEPRGIEALADRADSALAAYAEALCREIAPRALGPLGCGERHLRLLLQHRHFIDLDAEGARAVLQAAVERTAEELEGLGGTPEPEGGETQAAGAVVPTADRLETYRRESERLRRYLLEAALFTLPGAPLLIRERCACPRPPRMGSDYHAGGDGGTLYLAASGGEPLVRVRAAVRRGTWGGAHLLAFAGGSAARGMPRRLCAGSSVELAWGLYLDDRLAERGYLAPEDRRYALLGRRHSLRLALLDLDLHLGSLSDRLAEGVGRREFMALVRRPGDALAGALGWLALSGARSYALGSDAGASAEFDLHERLLVEGRIPLPLGLEAALGAEGWRAIAAAWTRSSRRALPFAVEIAAPTA